MDRILAKFRSRESRNMSVGMVIFHILFISACVGASWYAGYHAGRSNALNKTEKIALDK